MKERIKTLRKSLKLTQQSFAESLNIGKSTVEAYEYGRSNIPERTIKDICRIYGVSEEWLRTGSGDMLNAKSRNADIAKITAQMFKAEETDFRYQLQLIVSAMTDEELQLLKKIALKLAETTKEPQQ